MRKFKMTKIIKVQITLINQIKPRIKIIKTTLTIRHSSSTPNFKKIIPMTIKLASNNKLTY